MRPTIAFYPPLSHFNEALRYLTYDQKFLSLFWAIYKYLQSMKLQIWIGQARKKEDISIPPINIYE